ncbi:hypothetical protein BDR07DRAFT_1057950 [Suillus spraguei]|nr:hypothetical protein BDR07DRAFT_1057950 [Suillus spraguei]
MFNITLDLACVQLRPDCPPTRIWEFAIQPKVSRMIITISELPAWTIEVVNPHGITVNDVLLKISETLNRGVTSHEMQMHRPSHAVNAAIDSFRARSRADQREHALGVKRWTFWAQNSSSLASLELEMARIAGISTSLRMFDSRPARVTLAYHMPSFNTSDLCISDSPPTDYNRISSLLTLRFTRICMNHTLLTCFTIMDYNWTSILPLLHFVSQLTSAYLPPLTFLSLSFYISQRNVFDVPDRTIHVHQDTCTFITHSIPAMQCICIMHVIGFFNSEAVGEPSGATCFARRLIISTDKTSRPLSNRNNWT